MTVSLETTQIIRSKAAAEWPDDFEMQRDVIEEQTEAAEKMFHYQQNLDTTNEIVDTCLRKSLSEWPNDFSMQVHVFEGQIDAASNFFEYENPKVNQEVLEGIKTKAFSEWPDDYEMMLHVLIEQVAAWEELYG
ncbi:hypothetical protein NBRC116594_36360 [Shimia sp. NS0008-38b]|uniref:hypothetical protein n=1 Tax=Shimia sp. NS0008-38b TaxID=3127653 RepID=UPI00310531B2